MSYLPDKILSAGQETIDKIMEVAPFIVIGILWLLGAIAKTLQSSKKGKQTIEPMKPVKKRQPEDLADFIRMVKEQYAAAKEQAAEKAEQASEKVSQIQQAVSRQYQESYRKPPMFEVTTPPPAPTVEKPITEEPKPALEPLSVTSEQFSLTGDYLSGELASPFERYVLGQYMKDISSQFANAAGIRRAVIYSEVLRPPLALRD